MEGTGVKHTDITKHDIQQAEILAKEMGELKNSITKGQGNIHGFLGEIIVAKFLDIKISNTYDYDMIFKDIKIDVKTKRVTTPPRDYYECSVAALNTKQRCNIYVFTRILKDRTQGWILGYINKEDYFKKATFLKKGEVDPSNNWKVSTDCYNLPIKELNNIEELLSETH